MIEEEYSNEIYEIKKLIKKWTDIVEDLREFDGDRRGMLQALVEAECDLAELVGVYWERGND